VAREDEAGDGAVIIVPGALWGVKEGRKGKTTLLGLGGGKDEGEEAREKTRSLQGQRLCPD